MNLSKKVFQTATLSSNCPECFSNNSLLFTVSQKEVNTPWFYRLTDDLSEKIECQKCETTIYPVRYTDDIERVKAFYLRSMGTPTTTFRLKGLTYAILALIMVAAVASYLFLNTPELFTAAP
ncbi:hypothetical protein [Robertkochia flava]|uniref:hypothetical protein n=1 Tax=Robertkochia flava TaxID=3447986 RepID=UPI001CC9AE74|nr:hypothetical protein [Robertkochia marina]